MLFYYVQQFNVKNQCAVRFDRIARTMLAVGGLEGIKRLHLEPTGINCSASTHPGITCDTPNTAGSPRCTELSNTVPLINVP